MRVAFVTVGDTGRLTGGYLYNRRLLDGLRENGVGVEEVVPCGADPAEQAGSAPDLGAFDPARFDAVVVDALARVVVASHLDRWRSVRPVVSLVHELPGVADPSAAALERPFEVPLLRSDRLVAVSGHGRGILLGKGVPPNRVAVVPPGVDGLGPVPEDPPRREGTPRVLCVGQWIPRKGILDLARAWRTAGRPGAALDLVGETRADEVYAAQVLEAVSGDPSVTVHGPVGDATLAGLYASADLFALPSRYEGYGIVYAEALSFGLPVVACPVGPVPGLLGDGSALLVPPGDTDALSGALGLLLSDAGLREEMSAAARRRAAGLPRWRESVEGFLGVLRGVVVGRGG